MRNIPIAAVPNQAFTVRLDDQRYDIVLKETAGVMSATISRDDEKLLDNARIVGGTPLLNYKHLEEGNLFLLTENDDLPDWRKFGVTQTLVYVTRDEVGVLDGSI